ncbi:MAG: DUF1761 domain-containing protein [Candidatus Aenigmarchaeota archaeon]|nr:DUF1761 domain-containing protein [Candidatus Aenigmarchaeota archaeon]
MLPEFLLAFGVYPVIFAAAITAFAIGFIWHGMVFGKQWVALVGFSKKEIESGKKKGMGKPAFTQFVISVVMSFALFSVLSLTEATTIPGATMTAFWVWLGFVATVQLGPVVWEKTPFKLYLINTGYYLVSMIAVANVIVILLT